MGYRRVCVNRHNRFEGDVQALLPHRFSICHAISFSVTPGRIICIILPDTGPLPPMRGVRNGFLRRFAAAYPENRVLDRNGRRLKEF
jgi:hypothetical protein